MPVDDLRLYSKTFASTSRKVRQVPPLNGIRAYYFVCASEGTARKKHLPLAAASLDNTALVTVIQL